MEQKILHGKNNIYSYQSCCRTHSSFLFLSKINSFSILSLTIQIIGKTMVFENLK